MALSIHSNLMAGKTAQDLITHYAHLSDSVRKLSSGLRISSAADDAAVLAIRELMRADITGLRQAMRNANDAISMIQTADGALSIIDEKLICMNMDPATGIDTNSHLYGFTSADYDGSQLNSGPGTYDPSGNTLSCSTYNGMTIGYSGDPDQHVGIPNDGSGQTRADYEVLTIDEATEDLIVALPGLASACFSDSSGTISIRTQDLAQKALERIDTAILTSPRPLVPKYHRVFASHTPEGHAYHRVAQVPQRGPNGVLAPVATLWYSVGYKPRKGGNVPPSHAGLQASCRLNSNQPSHTVGYGHADSDQYPATDAGRATLVITR